MKRYIATIISGIVIALSFLGLVINNYFIFIAKKSTKINITTNKVLLSILIITFIIFLLFAFIKISPRKKKQKQSKPKKQKEIIEKPIKIKEERTPEQKEKLKRIINKICKLTMIYTVTIFVLTLAISISLFFIWATKAIVLTIYISLAIIFIAAITIHEFTKSSK